MANGVSDYGWLSFWVWLIVSLGVTDGLSGHGWWSLWVWLMVSLVMADGLFGCGWWSLWVWRMTSLCVVDGLSGCGWCHMPGTEMTHLSYHICRILTGPCILTVRFMISWDIKHYHCHVVLLSWHVMRHSDEPSLSLIPLISEYIHKECPKLQFP